MLQARETLEAGQALALCRSGVNRYGKWMNTFELKLPEDYHTLEDLALCLMIRYDGSSSSVIIGSMKHCLLL